MDKVSDYPPDCDFFKRSKIVDLLEWSNLVFRILKLNRGTYNLVKVHLVLLHLKAFLRPDKKSLSSG